MNVQRAPEGPAIRASESVESQLSCAYLFWVRVLLWSLQREGRASRGGRAFLVTLGLLGCQTVQSTEPDGPWQRWDSDNITVYSRPSDALADVPMLATIESRVQDFWEYHQIPESERPQLVWYRFEDDADYSEHAEGSLCAESTRACTKGTTIYGPERSFHHELTHALMARVGGPPVLFREGHAIALSCSPRTWDLAKVELDWRELLHYEASAESAARFVNHLIERFGVEPLVALYRDLEVDADAERTEQVFSHIYDNSIDEVWAHAQRSEQSCNNSLWSCASQAAEGVFELAPEVDLTGRWRSLNATHPSRLEVSEALPYPDFRECDLDQATGLEPNGRPGFRATWESMWFIPGEYPVTLQNNSLPQVPVLEVQSLSELDPTSCDATLVLHTDELDQKGLVVAPSQSWKSLQLVASAPETLSLLADNSLEAWLVQFCAVCEQGQPSSCEERLGWSFDEAGHNVWVRLRSRAELPRRFLTLEWSTR